MHDLTEKQQRALRVLRNFHKLHGYMPSVREFARALALSPNGAVQYLVALEKKGIIKRASDKARAITILT